MSIVGAIAVPHPPLIVPAVGRGEEQRISETIGAYKRATKWLLSQQPDCLVITSPHAPLFRDAFHVTTDDVLEGSMAQFRAPQERMSAECNAELAREIISEANEAGIPAIGSERYRDDMDHATYVPLYFVREAAGGMLPCPIVRIGLSGMPYDTHRQLGRIIAQAANAQGLNIGFIASGDLSHKLTPDGPYGFAPEGPVFDERIGEIFSSGNLDGLFELNEAFCEAAAECGLRSFQIMAGALDGLSVHTELLSNEGPFGVGYGVAICACESTTKCDAQAGKRDADNDHLHGANPPTEVDPIVRLARLTVETFTRTGRAPNLPDDLPQDLLERKAGVFVTIHKQGALRGCIGTISPTCSNIAEEVIQNGISSSSRDPRFPAIREEELDYLEYSVDVLGEAEPIDSPEQLDPKRYGVIVTKRWQRGLLLPNLEGVETIESQVSIAKQKAGIDPADNDVELARFEVVRHSAGGEARR